MTLRSSETSLGYQAALAFYRSHGCSARLPPHLEDNLWVNMARSAAYRWEVHRFIKTPSMIHLHLNGEDLLLRALQALRLVSERFEGTAFELPYSKLVEMTHLLVRGEQVHMLLGSALVLKSGVVPIEGLGMLIPWLLPRNETPSTHPLGLFVPQANATRNET